jgi:hypothetical protein
MINAVPASNKKNFVIIDFFKEVKDAEGCGVSFEGRGIETKSFLGFPQG